MHWKEVWEAVERLTVVQKWFPFELASDAIKQQAKQKLYNPNKYVLKSGK